MNIGKLRKVDLRKVWAHEARDFTNWLAEPENLAILSSELDLELVNAETEISVGSFSVDILAEDQSTDRKVVIENQLEDTNHDHLGKIITYASGLEAGIIVWIVKKAREEHEQAIDWLNEHTDENVSFFIIRMEAWQIGESEVAPKFHIVSKPNDWAKAVKKTATSRGATDYKLYQQKFWEQLKVEAEPNGLRFQKAHPQHWLNLSIGKAGTHVSLTLNSFANTIACELYIGDNLDKKVYNKLLANKVQIEKEIGTKLDWRELPGKKASRILAIKKGNIDNEDEWVKYNRWLIQKATSFQKVFAKWL